MYGSEIVTPKMSLRRKLDVVQNSALRCIFGTVAGCSIAWMRYISGLSSIVDQWEYNRLKYFGKVLIEMRDSLPGKVLIDEIYRSNKYPNIYIIRKI